MEIVFTPIVRDPVKGPVFFGEHGPENNKTAVHTEQVLASSGANYDFWTRELGVPRKAWPLAFWGESITVDGLDETSYDRCRQRSAGFSLNNSADVFPGPHGENEPTAESKMKMSVPDRASRQAPPDRVGSAVQGRGECRSRRSSRRGP